MFKFINILKLFKWTLLLYIFYFTTIKIFTHTPNKKEWKAKPWHMSLWKESKGLGHVIWT